MQNHNERMYNAIGGYGYITNAEVRQIQGTAWVKDPETGEYVFAGSAVWAEEGAWHDRGILGQIGLGLRGFADELTMGFVSYVERKQGRLSSEEEEWLKTSSVHNGGATAGFCCKRSISDARSRPKVKSYFSKMNLFPKQMKL